MIIRGTVRIHPTEDPEKVKTSVTNIFPGSELSMDDDMITFTTEDPTRFVDHISSQLIRDTATRFISHSLQDGSARFYLNKQAAFMGDVNFTDGDSTLGDIYITVEDADALIDMISTEHA